MKIFFFKLIYFCSIPVAFLIYYFSYNIPDDEILNNALECKILSLDIDTNQTNIIIAGDSRALMQLVPKIINEHTGLNTINVASSACDLITSVAAIKQKYTFDSSNIFVISASSWQINDQSIDRGYLSLKCFHEIPWFIKFWLFKDNLRELFRLRNELMETYNKKKEIGKDTTYTEDLGFMGIDSILDVNVDIKSWQKRHPWYKNLRNNGIRWSLFKKALKEIGNKNSLFIIYQPPISHFWRTSTLGTFIDVAEQEYSLKVKAEIEKYTNVVFFDFYRDDIRELNDSLFYDAQHLNIKGAEVFSGFLSKKILENYCRVLYKKNGLY